MGVLLGNLTEAVHQRSDFIFGTSLTLLCLMAAMMLFV